MCSCPGGRVCGTPERERRPEWPNRVIPCRNTGGWLDLHERHDTDETDPAEAGHQAPSGMSRFDQRPGPRAGPYAMPCSHCHAPIRLSLMRVLGTHDLLPQRGAGARRNSVVSAALADLR